MRITIYSTVTGQRIWQSSIVQEWSEVRSPDFARLDGFVIVAQLLGRPSRPKVLNS